MCIVGNGNGWTHWYFEGVQSSPVRGVHGPCALPPYNRVRAWVPDARIAAAFAKKYSS